MPGFNCEFVELPPKAFPQSVCPIFLVVLREPFQATCCGKSFCKECIEQVKINNQVCPTCNDRGFNLFHNKRLQQSLYDFQVYCSHKSKGCEWTGELRELDKHLNSEPPADKSLEGCPFTVINCPLSHTTGCEVRLPRKDVKIHLNDELLNHILKQGSQMKVLEQQLFSCKSDGQILHQLVEEKRHLEWRISQVETRNADLKRQVNDLNLKLEVTSEDLKEKVKELNSKLKAIPPCACTCVVELTVMKYARHKKDGDKWYSKPFYSHAQGYKMCLEVVANGWATATGTHLSVYIHLMCGEFDEILKWPFRGDITVQLLNQESDGGCCTRVISYSKDTLEVCTSRVSERERFARGHGFRFFIPHSYLEQEYLKNDCLKFRIQKVVLK